MSNTDKYLWIAKRGGAWSAAANWTDTTAGSSGAPASSPPGAGNAVTIIGPATTVIVNGNTTTVLATTIVTGTGAAAQLTIGNDVLLLGTVAVSGALTLAPQVLNVSNDTYSPSTFLELDGRASVTAGSLTIGLGGQFNVGGGSSFTAAGTAVLSNAILLATDGSTVRLGGLIGSNNVQNVYGLNNYGSTIAVDDNSSVEIGTAGGAAAGTVTIDKGKSAVLSGTIFGNVVVNGTLGVQAGGNLQIDGGYNFDSGDYFYGDSGDPYGTAQRIGGQGTLKLSEGSTLGLGAADSAAIQFAGPSGTLSLLSVPVVGTISGFAAGDVIEVGGLATGLSYAIGATSTTLTLREGGKLAGTLTLAGNYAGSVFHLGFDFVPITTSAGALITVQTIGSSPAQPSIIAGRAGADVLTATTNNQILTGLGGGDTLDGGSFTGIDFRDTTADLNGSTIRNFSTSDLLDFTDLVPAKAKLLSYTGGVLSVTDGTHAATLSVGFTTPPASGHFFLAADSTGKGTDMTWHS